MSANRDIDPTGLAVLCGQITQITIAGQPDQILNDIFTFMEISESGASSSGDLRLLLFFLPLRNPIPIPHGSTFAFELKDPVTQLAGVPVLSGPDLLPVPGSDSWPSHASLKFWQVSGESDYNMQHLDAAFKVINAVKGGQPADIPPSEPATITVVEMVIVVPSGTLATDREPFLRCLDCLVDMVDAYRISTKENIPHLSYEQLGPFVTYMYRSMHEPYEWEGPSVMLLNHSNVRVLNPEPLTPNQLERLMLSLRTLRTRHPFASWIELCRDRDYAFHVEGDYRRTVVQAALATEVLVYNTLSCLLWESTLPTIITDADIQSAFEILNKDAKSLRAELGKRLGGDWGSDNSASSIWQKNGARIRNRVLHAGYRPTRDEAAGAITAAVDLSKMLERRLAAKANQHHRTAVLLLGDSGLKRLGVLSKRLIRLLDESVSEPDWVKSYREWSQRISDYDPRI